MHAKVIWFEPNVGGRPSGPPSGSEYRPNALFVHAHSERSQPVEVEFGSVRFLFSGEDRSVVELDFWSPQDLSRHVFDGSTFLVMEANRPVGFARMVDEP